jgi:hypothetical protein
MRGGDGMFDTPLCCFGKLLLRCMAQSIGCVASRTCCTTHCVQVLLHVRFRLGGLHKVCLAALTVNLWMLPLHCCLSRLPCFQDLGPLLDAVKFLLQLMQAICHVDRALRRLNLLLVPLLLMMLLFVSNWTRPGRRGSGRNESGCLRWCHLRLHGAVDASEAWAAKALPAHTLPTVCAWRVAHGVLVKLAVTVATEETLNARTGSIVAAPMTEAIVGA